MRSDRSILLTALVLLLAACGPGAAGWHGSDVHLVDGTWIGTERACGDGKDGTDLECRTIVEKTMSLLAPDVRSGVTRAVRADLPTTYVTTAGETRTAQLRGGLSGREAVVIDQVGGTRQVIGLWCYLPYSVNGDLKVGDVTCGIEPFALEYWRDGNAPPSFPPGAVFG